MIVPLQIRTSWGLWRGKCFVHKKKILNWYHCLGGLFFTSSFSTFFRDENMEISGIPTPPPLISEDEHWSIFLEDEPSFDLSMFFTQALEMMDRDEEEKKEKKEEKENDYSTTEKTQQGGSDQPKANVCDSIENGGVSMVSSKFIEEQKKEMAAFLHKLDPRQGPTAFDTDFFN